MSAQNEAFEKANPHKLISVTSDQVEVLNELRKYNIQKKSTHSTVLGERGIHD